MTIAQEIAFDRALTGKKTIVVCSGLIVSCFILGTLMGLPFGAFAVSNVLIFLFLLATFQRSYHHSWRFNLIVLLAYLFFTAVEYLSFGLPGLLIPIGEGIGYGTLMEVLIISLPYFYIGLRIMMAIPLLMLFLVSKKVEADQKSSPRDR